jgi:antibiotic biosynthesis monooxygenase (ABM) superfamily enzyme
MTKLRWNMQDQKSRLAPSKFRFALLVYCGVYPLVTVGLAVLSPFTADWPLPLKTLVLVPIIVVSMVWGIIPFIQSRLRHLL